MAGRIRRLRGCTRQIAAAQNRVHSAAVKYGAPGQGLFGSLDYPIRGPSRAVASELAESVALFAMGTNDGNQPGGSADETDDCRNYGCDDGFPPPRLYLTTTSLFLVDASAQLFPLRCHQKARSRLGVL